MYVARIYVLALCWPTGSTGARDESFHTRMELEVRQNAVVSARSRHGDTANSKLNESTSSREEDQAGSRRNRHHQEEHHDQEKPGNGKTKKWNVATHEHKEEEDDEGTAPVELQSHFWQERVPVWLGLHTFDGKECAKDSSLNVKSKRNNWLSRLGWFFPVMIPPIIAILSYPVIYYYSKPAARADMGTLTRSYAGFFIANWAILFILKPGIFVTMFEKWGIKLFFDVEINGIGYTIHIGAMLMIFTVASCGIIFRVAALALSEGISCVHASATIKPDNIYMNLNRPISQVIMKFTGQSFLMWMYCAYLQDTATQQLAFRSCSAARMQFVCIIMVVLPCLQGVFRDALGKEFIANLGQWMVLIRAREYEVAGEEQSVITRVEIYNRLMMDFLVNQVYLGILLFTMHSLCFHASYIDLVTNLFAVAFITTLDDEADDATDITIIGDEDDKDGEAAS